MPIAGYSAKEIADLIPGAERNGKGYRAPCPHHHGENPNLSIIDSPDGAVITCFSQDCKITDFIKTLNLENRREKRADGSSTRTVYDYPDEQGNILFHVVIDRYPDRDKKVRQCRPDPAKPGALIWDTKGVRKCIYRLPQVLDAISHQRTILKVEGEKCVHAAESLGFDATTNPQGAGKWRDEYSESLRGAHVVILPDNDDVGRKHADQVIASLCGIAASVKRIDLPGLREKGDICDWIQAGGTREELDDLIAKAPLINAEQNDSIDDERDRVHRPKITHDPTDIKGAVNATIAALKGSGAPIWQRDGLVMTVLKSIRKARFGLHDDGERLRMTIAEAAYLVELATECADHLVPSYYRNETQYFKPGSCPPKTIDHLLKRPYQSFSVLNGITTVPALRHDGSVITVPGYDEATGLLYAPIDDFPNILDAPTIDNAKAALERLREPFCDFPFSEKCDENSKTCHESAAIAAVLSIIARHLVRTVPLFAVTSNTRGSGKGLLVNVIGTIATGTEPSKSSGIKDDEEMRKQLLVIAMDGDRTTVFDNVEGVFGTASLDRCLTEPFAKDRILGQSKRVEVELQTVFFLTGNSVKYRGDTARRVVSITFSPDCENPEELTDFTHKQLLSWVQENQPRLLVDALTILRAFMLANQPKQDITNYGSFEMWSDLVRSALVWCDMPDPCEGRKHIEQEADHGYENVQRLLHAWNTAYPREPNGAPNKVQLSAVVKAVQAENPSQALQDLGSALAAFDPKSNDKVADISVSRIVQRLPLNDGRSRIIDDMQLRSEKDASKRTRSFWVHVMKPKIAPDDAGDEPHIETDDVGDEPMSEYDDSNLPDYEDDYYKNKVLFDDDESIPF